jgi:hypothetical protein
MSYATIPTFEGTSIGVRRLRTLSGAGHMLGGLGDTKGDLDAAVAAGIISQNDADTLQALGVTDAQAIALLNQQTDFSSLMYLLATGSSAASLPQPQPVSLFTGLSQPTSPGSSTSPSGGINPAVAPTPPTYQIPAQIQAVPAGSTLTFTASWSASFAHPLTSGDTAIASMTTGLARYGISILSSSPTSNGPINYAIQLVCRNNVAFQQWADVQSIFTSLIQSIVGNNLTATPQLVLTAIGGQLPPSATPPPPQTLTQWFEANWGYLAAVLAAVVILPPVIKKL